MAMALRDIAKLLGGRLQGDGWLVISGAAIIRDAREGDITLADNPKLATQVSQSKASAVIVMGTVKGDLHDIGKNLVGMMAEGAGFTIVDLGTDTSADK